MPLYEYRCDTCEETFEMRRPMAEASAPVTCAQGHPAHRLLSAFMSVVGGGSSPAPSPAPAHRHSGGCSCAHH